MVGALLGLTTSAALGAAIGVGDLLGVVDIGGLAVSPDGRRIAFRTEQASLSRNRIETRWWTVPVDGRAPARALADGGEALIGGAGVVAPEKAFWSRDGWQLFVRSAAGDGVQVRAIDTRSGRVRRVTRAAGDVTAFALGANGLAIDFAEGPPRALIRAAERRLHDRGALVDDRVDLTVGVIGGSWSLGRSQSIRLTGDWFDRRPLLDPDDARGWRQPLTGGAPTRIAAMPQWPAYVPPEAVRKARVCAQLDCTRERIDAIVPVPALRADLVTTHAAGPGQTLHLVDDHGARILLVTNGLASGSRQSTEPCVVAGPRAVCVLADADGPPRLAVIALASGAIKTLFAPNQALAARTRDTAEKFVWKDTEGRAFNGQLFLPRGFGPAAGFPLVVQYYWCDGFLRGGQGDELPIAPLAANGIAVLCINKRPLDQTIPDSVADYRLAASGIAAAIDQLAARGLVDRRRVGMQGLSFGSQVTMWVASQTSLLRVAAIASGQVEPVSYWYGARPSSDFAARLKEGWGLEDPDQLPERWQATTPAKQVAHILAPLLMQLPESEARWSIELYAKLRRSPTPVELYAFPDAAHVKALPRQKAAAYERNLAWFRFWLKGERQDDSDDPGRFARWTELARRNAQARPSSQSSASASSSSRM